MNLQGADNSADCLKNRENTDFTLHPARDNRRSNLSLPQEADKSSADKLELPQEVQIPMEARKNPTRATPDLTGVGVNHGAALRDAAVRREEIIAFSDASESERSAGSYASKSQSNRDDNNRQNSLLSTEFNTKENEMHQVSIDFSELFSNISKIFE